MRVQWGMRVAVACGILGLAAMIIDDLRAE